MPRWLEQPLGTAATLFLKSVHIFVGMHLTIPTLLVAWLFSEQLNETFLTCHKTLVHRQLGLLGDEACISFEEHLQLLHAGVLGNRASLYYEKQMADRQLERKKEWGQINLAKTFYEFSFIFSNKYSLALLAGENCKCANMAKNPFDFWCF